MDKIETDIVIAGGGVAGLVAAITFAADGHKVLCVDPVPPVTDGASADADLRSTAYLVPACNLFKEIGLWHHLEPQATRLDVMRLIDAGGVENLPRQTSDFVAQDIGQESFGVNVLNWMMRKALMAALESSTAELRALDRVTRITTRLDGVRVRLASGAMVHAKLLLGADGRNSFVRESSGIRARRWGYDQTALVFAVTHPVPHQNISTELHRTGGPFTLVPMPDHEGSPQSAVVWMEDAAQAQALMDLDEVTFSAAASERSCGVQGRLTLNSRRAAWPIISLLADRMNGPRTALMAEAAHVMPPIGAQGLNTSLGDVRALRDLMRGADDIGDEALLTRYNRMRHPQAVLRVKGVDALNRAAQTNIQALRDLRMQGLRALSTVTPVKHGLMQLGLGRG
ncbi:MAG: FAD-dependent monooxygenase [Pseudomonadota bacterium]